MILKAEALLIYLYEKTACLLTTHKSNKKINVVFFKFDVRKKREEVINFDSKVLAYTEQFRKVRK